MRHESASTDGAAAVPVLAPGVQATSGEQTGTPAPTPGRSSSETTRQPAAKGSDAPAAVKHTWRFWVLLFSLAVANLLTAIEGTIITNTLPTIVAELGGGSLYPWIANAYFLTSVATLPLYGQACNILGRRWLMLGAVAVFMLGSGIAGGARDMGMLIAGRAIQGLGGGGISMLTEVIVTDMVALRDRGKYLAIVMIAAVVGAAIGPFVGGAIVDQTTWRWVFYINLPLGAAGLILLFFFLHTNYQRGQTVLQRLARIDYMGNFIFILANVAILIALTWGGAVYPWSSYRVIVPLVLGFVGLGLFTAFEWSPKLCPEPSFPRVLVSNRTSAAALFLTFIHAICTYWSIYYLPIYFQSVRSATPLASGVYTLPMFVGTVPFAIVGGLLLSKTGRYKPFHLFGFALATISFGLLSLLDRSSSAAAWVCYQLLGAVGLGVLAAILLPAVQAPLAESEVATATGTWSFFRGFGALFAFTIPSTVFNNESAKRASSISNSKIAALLSGGQAYEYATRDFLDSIPDPDLRDQVIHLFSEAMRMVWLIGVIFAGLGFLAAWIEKEVKLREELDTEFGLDEKVKQSSPEEPNTTV